MPALEFPRTRVGLIQELGSRLLDGRKPKTGLETLARGLLTGFHDICLRCGLDRVLAELAEAHPPLDPSDRSALGDHPTLLPGLVALLEAADLDAGGPRNARPGQLADAVVTALGLSLVDEPDRSVAFPEEVRAEVHAAVAAVVDQELAIPQIREAIITTGRAQCERRYHAAFDKIAAHLDERGTRLLKQPNLPLDAVQAVQRALFDARNAVVERAARAAIDRAKDVIGKVDAAAAGRIDLPVTLQLTPREVAIRRACEPSVPKVPAAIATSLLDSLAELARLVWRAPVRVARTYAPSQTFAVGDLLDHPKFGRGSVVSCAAAKIEVEFADGKHTLVHVMKR